MPVCEHRASLFEHFFLLFRVCLLLEKQFKPWRVCGRDNGHYSLTSEYSRGRSSVWEVSRIEFSCRWDSIWVGHSKWWHGLGCVFSRRSIENTASLGSAAPTKKSFRKMTGSLVKSNWQPLIFAGKHELFSFYMTRKIRTADTSVLQ